jgi:flavin-dependent dehydrogenase
MKKVTIVGYGPSAAALVSRLTELGYPPKKITVFTGGKEYTKPCGEAVPKDGLAVFRQKPRIYANIRKFVIGTRERKYAIDFEEPEWIIIDKKELIERHRTKQEKEGVLFHDKRTRPENVEKKYGGIIVDARGPFTVNGLTKIPVARAIIDTGEKLDKVVLKYVPEKIGFYWMFPSQNNKVNIGYGSFIEKKPEKMITSFFKGSGFKNVKTIEYKVSLVTVGGLVGKELFGNRFYIGEAAGYVYPMTGEGIRPSYTHGLYIAEKIFEIQGIRIEHNMDIHRRVAKARKQIRFQKKLLDIFVSMKPEHRKLVFRCLGKNDFISLLKENIDYRMLLRIALRCPYLSLNVFSKLLSH